MNTLVITKKIIVDTLYNYLLMNTLVITKKITVDTLYNNSVNDHTSGN